MRRCRACNGTGALIFGDGPPVCKACISEGGAIATAEAAEAERTRQTYAWRLMHGDHGGRTAA